MQYRQFSMPSSAPWFPEAPLLPALSKEAMVQIQTRNEVPQIRPTHSLYTEEGQSALQEMVGISTKKATIIDLYSNTSQDERQRAETYNIMLPHLQGLENRAMVEQNLRAGDEADGVDNVARYKNVVDLTEEGSLSSVDKTDDTVGTTTNAYIIAQRALDSLNTTQHGYIMMIDYIANASKYPDGIPNIATVVPSIINPKAIWDANATVASQKLSEFQRSPEEFVADNVIDVEQVETQVVPVQLEFPDDASHDGDSSGDEEDARRVAAPTPKKSNEKQDKSVLVHIIKAVAGIKRTSAYMISCIDKGRYQTTNRLFNELTYSEIYSSKPARVTPQDLQYYENRKTVEGILQQIQNDIDEEPPFEFLPQEFLSDKQIQYVNDRRKKIEEEAKIVEKLVAELLSRPKQTTVAGIRSLLRKHLINRKDNSSFNCRNVQGRRAVKVNI